MGLVFLRTLIIFAILLALMRLMGKRQIGEMQPYELVITLIIADLACIPMGDTTIPLLYGIVALVTVYLLHQVVCLIDLKCFPAKVILSGEPSIVINKRGIDDTQLKKNNLNVADLVESLRNAGYFSLDAIDYALYEASGNFSTLPKKDYESYQKSLPVIVVSEGKFSKKNLEQTKRNQTYYLDVLRGQGCDELKKVLIMTVDGDGKVYLQQKGKSYQTFSLDWEETLW